MAVCGLVAVLAGVFTAAFKRRLARSFVENESLNRLEQERSFECLLEHMGLGMIFVGAVVIVTTSLSAVRNRSRGTFANTGAHQRCFAAHAKRRRG